MSEDHDDLTARTSLHDDLAARAALRDDLQQDLAAVYERYADLAAERGFVEMVQGLRDDAEARRNWQARGREYGAKLDRQRRGGS